MTQPEQSPQFAIEIWDDGLLVATTHTTWDLPGVRGHLERIQREYPSARMKMRSGDAGEWREVADDDMDRIAYRAALAVLDSMSRADLPLLTWTVNATDGRALVAAWVHADPRGLDVMQAYADYLDAEVAPHGDAYLRVAGMGAGVQVQITMNKPAEREVAA